MKRFSCCTIALVLLLGACTNKLAKKEPVKASAGTTAAGADIPYTQADRYFVRNDYVAAEHPDPRIRTAAEFEKIFGMAAVMGASPTQINFTTQDVIAIIEAASDLNPQITIRSLKKEGDQLVVRYLVSYGQKTTYTIQPALLLLIDKKQTGTVRLEKQPL